MEMEVETTISDLVFRVLGLGVPGQRPECCP